MKTNFLFIFSHGHHDTFAKLALDETLEFSKAIQRAVNITNESDTLIIVTADHSHAMSVNGYANRGNDIFGVAGIGDDKLPFMTLSYANGNGYHIHVKKDGGREDIGTLDTSPIDFEFPATVPRDSETHGGKLT